MFAKRLFQAAIPALFAVSATADTGARLTSDDLKRELFGVHLSGRTVGLDAKFDECIEPSGRAIYRLDGQSLPNPIAKAGQFKIDARRDQACFVYAGSSTCFRVYRRGGGYLFDAVRNPSRFLVTDVKRGVRQCSLTGNL